MDITRGPDGNLWFAEEYGKICRITPAGVVTEFPLPGFPADAAIGVAADSDGNIWFTDTERGQIGRITP